MGSAAFNLLVISAVSIVAVQETKKINDLGTFIVTACSSTFAYIWVFVVLTVNTPDEVELWEAIVTLAFFFILLIMAYTTDRFKARTENSEEEKKKN